MKGLNAAIIIEMLLRKTPSILHFLSLHQESQKLAT